MRYRSALITGASSGIGEALARALPDTTDLLLTGRREDALAELAGVLARPGRRVEFFAADLARAEALEAVIAAAEAFEIDLLINNAGLGLFGPIASNSRARETELVMLNVVAPTVLTNALLGGMLARAQAQGGRAGIIIVGSVLSFFSVPRMTTYAATKAFDLSYALGLASELRGQPADVLALCPGTTATRFGERAGSKPSMAALGHSAEQVAVAGLAALGRRQVLVVGLGNSIVTGFARLLPITLFARMVAAVSPRIGR
jgi:short-subunit dehydrogenase